MKTFAAILLLSVVAASKRSGGHRSRDIVGAESIKAKCTSMSDDGLMKLHAAALSLEADGSGDVISPDRVANKVAAA